MAIYIDGIDTNQTVTAVNGATITASGGIGSPVAGKRVEYFPQETTASPSTHPTDPAIRILHLPDLAATNINLSNLRVEYLDGVSNDWLDAGRVVHADGPLVLFDQAAGFPGGTTFRFVRDNTFDEILGRVDPTNTTLYSATTTAALTNRKIDAALFQSVATSSAGQFQNLDAGAARQIEGLRNGIAASVAVVVTATANTIATWQSSNEANETLEKSLMDQKEAISGVNLDEEAANLVKYQQLYNASSKLLQAGRQMFDTLLSMLTVN
jgi:flagellar hook-associated protein FlgK